MPDDDYTDYYKKPTTSKGYLSASHYNYRKLARRIVKGCRTDYQKIKAIYQWICSNIDNDMTYSIHTAAVSMHRKARVRPIANCSIAWRAVFA